MNGKNQIMKSRNKFLSMVLNISIMIHLKSNENKNNYRISQF